MNKSLISGLQTLDRRYVFLFMVIAVIIPFAFDLSFDEVATPEVQAIFQFIEIDFSDVLPIIEMDSLFIILFLLPRKIFFSIWKSFVSQFNSQPSPFDRLINIEFPAFVLTILVFG